MEIARERIKQLRLERGESQQIVADANGVDRSSYARYEDGSRRLPSVVVASLARYYGVSSDYILGLTNERTVNMELRAVCEYTGLNESAVQILCQRKTDQRFFFDAEIYVGKSKVIGYAVWLLISYKQRRPN